MFSSKKSKASKEGVSGGRSHLRPFQLVTMQTIKALDCDAYGAEIERALTTRLRSHVHEAQVYSAIRRLCSRGFITPRETRVVRSSPPLKIYALTSEGERALSAAVEHYAAIFNPENVSHATPTTSRKDSLRQTSARARAGPKR